MEPKICEHCGKQFVASYHVTKAYWAKRRFCSDGCRERGHHPPPRTGARQPVEERFWKKVIKGDDNECWPWVGARDGCGYGVMVRNKQPRKVWRSNRLSWELHNGPIQSGLHVLHSCDNPPCCNPKHLWLGTQADNNLDRDRKGRGGQIGSPGANRKGERNGNAKLSDEDIAAVRKLYATGWSQQRIADEYRVCQSQVSRIVRGEQRA